MYRLMCLKCGNTQTPYDGNKGNCIICNSKMVQIPDGYGFSDEEIEKFFSSSDNSDFDEYWEQNQQRLFEEIISKSPEFDINLYNSRDSIFKQKEQQQEAAIAHGKAVLEGRDKGNQFGVECPYCHATNVKRITTTSKAVHTAIFGIFSMGRNAKNYHCNHCNSDF